MGNFLILYKSIEADEFLKLLDDIDNDTLEVDGLKIRFFNGQTHQLNFEDWYSGHSERARERWGIDWSLDVFRWEVSHKLENELDKIFQNISLRLNCCDLAYEDVYTEEGICEKKPPIDAGFEYVCDFEGKKIFRKRK